LLEVEDLRETLVCANDVVDENETIIREMRDLLAGDQNYDYEEGRYSERIRQAGGKIQQIREQVLENEALWLEKIDRLQATVEGITNDPGFSTWLDALFDENSVHIETEGTVTVVGNAGALASRLSTNENVLGENTARITVLSKDEIGIVMYDQEGKHVPDGIKVSVRDAKGDPKAPLVEEVTKNGEAIDMTDIEYKIFRLLVQYHNKIFSIRNIYESVWEKPYFYDANNTVMVHIRRLRMAVEDDPRHPTYIRTEWGRGYRFVCE
jgi:hypothetical protein